MKKFFKTILFFWFFNISTYSQVGIPTNNPNKNAVLDLNRTDGTSVKGLLLPKVALTSASSALPMTAHVAGMHVWNTATAESGSNAVTPGAYYNDGGKWIRILSETEWYLDNTTIDAGSDKSSNIYRNGSVISKTSDNLKETLISGDGGIELYRAKTANEGIVNGYIDFKSDPSIDYQGRITYSEIGGTTTLGAKLRSGLNIIGGTTTLGFLSFNVVGAYSTRSGYIGGYGTNGFNINWSSNNAQLWIDNTNIGNITLTSDRRLKEKINPIKNDAITRTMNLKPVSFKYKHIPNSIFSGSDQVNEGFIADELQEIIPSAVNGTKNAVDKDGNIQAQTLNLGPLVSVLTKTFQEQQKEIEELTKRIKILENKQ